MKEMLKQEILHTTLLAKERCEAASAALTDAVSLSDYQSLAAVRDRGLIWTAALQTALNEHEVIIIPPSDEIYWLDSTVIIPSNRRIEASGAVIRLVPEYPYVMLRNEHTHDGTHAPIDPADRDCNITIHGGRWEESCNVRGARRYSAESGFNGVQTCMLFNNLEKLSITDVTFANATSFSMQVGDLTDGVFENIFFVSCYADGLHINGNCENLYIRNFSGHVGDDLVALNMYDWLGSSINYGPAKNIFCEDIHSAPDSTAKAMRLQPGIFIFNDGSAVDCSLTNIYIRKMTGVYEYKFYLQTPPYRLGTTPESGGVGSADNIFFEDISIVSERPGYPRDEPGTGYFGMFFLNSDIGYLSLKNIDYIVPENVSPRTYLIAAGPMTWRHGDVEIFDPYASAVTETLELENITINGRRVDCCDEIITTIEFDDVNQDGFSSGKGKISRIILDGKQVK